LVDLITEDQSPLDTANDDVVEDAGGVETSVAGHRPMVAKDDTQIKSYLFGYGRPQSPMCITGEWPVRDTIRFMRLLGPLPFQNDRDPLSLM
jgi:hypothetical protein